MKQKLLELLQSTEGFLSGQELSDHLNVSRTAVWKVMKSLEEDGYEIEAVRNKGYSLKKEPDILTKESCASRINTKWLGKNLMVYDVTDSTNTRLKLAGEQGAPNGSVAVANAQEAGKGRLGRHWETPKGSALAFSLLLRPQIQPENASMLTLVAALAVSRAIDEFAGIKTQIKWPNDIVYQGKKLCGILTEMSADMDQIHYVIVGIGINVQVTDFPKEIQNTATSLKLVTGKTLLRNKLLAKVLEEFEVLYEFVEKLPHILKPGGRVAILTFHSGEDRIVKKTFKEMKNSGVYEDVCRNVIRPTKEECHRNSRAKSTKMRWAIKAK